MHTSGRPQVGRDHHGLKREPERAQHRQRIDQYLMTLPKRGTHYRASHNTKARRVKEAYGKCSTGAPHNHNPVQQKYRPNIMMIRNNNMH